MNLRVVVNISMASSFLVLAACGPKNTYRGSQFPDITTFVDVAPKPDIQAASAKVLASAEEIAQALALKDAEKYNTPETSKQLTDLIEEAKNESFNITNAELNEIDASTTVDSNGFTKIENGKNISPRLKPLIAGILYKLEIAKEDSTVSIPGVILRKKIEPLSVGRERNEELGPEAKAIFEKLLKKTLVLKSIRIYDRSETLELAEIVSDSTVDLGAFSLTLNGIIAAGSVSAEGTFQGKISRDDISATEVLSLNADKMIERLLGNVPLKLTLLNNSSFVGDYKFRPLGQLLNEDFILDLEKELKKL